jgi:hypothetical protein
MALGIYDVLMIFMVLCGTMGFVMYYNSMVGKSVSFNTSVGGQVGRNTSLCDEVDCVKLQNQLNKIYTTTTTTIPPRMVNISVFNTSGYMTTIVSSNDGNILVDCGDSPKVMDRLFMVGIGNLSYSFITKIDSEHAAGCSRMFMLIPHKLVYDSGFADNSTWYTNYIFTTGGFRYVVDGKKNLKFGSVAGSVDNRAGRLILKLGYKNTTVSFVGECNNNIEYMSSDVVFCDDMVDESVLIKEKPYLYVLSKKNTSFELLGRKYGVNVVSPANFGVLTVVMDGNSVKYTVKK